MLIISLLGCGDACPRFVQTRVVAFGDSIIESQSPKSFAYLIAESLALPIENTAIGGTNITSPNQHSLIMSYDLSSSDVVIWMPGINDLHKFGVDPVALANYEHLLTEALMIMNMRGAQVFIGTTCRTLQPVLPDSGVDIYAEILRRVIRINNLPNVHMVETNLLFKPSGANLQDEVHPNNIGHEQLRDFFLAEITRFKK